MLSEAPADMPGATSTPGKRSRMVSVTAFTTSGRNGDGGLSTGGGGRTLISTEGSSITFASMAFTDATWVPGKIRQLMLPSASCGSALRAWPPSSVVAMQVVRIWPTYAGLVESVAAALASLGFAANEIGR